MLQKIQINLSNITFYGYLEINDFTKKIMSKFPLESDIQFWGDEIWTQGEILSSTNLLDILSATCLELVVVIIIIIFI